MPITAWACPSCNDPSAALDHFQTSAACAGVVDPAFAAAVLASDRERHTHHGPAQVHVTDGLGCPRKTAILWQESVAADPTKFTATFRGQAVHGVMEDFCPDTEGVNPEVPVAGELASVKVIGRIDRLNRPQSLIIDFKTPNDFGMRDRKKDGAKPEDKAQVSMYAELVKQSMGWRPERGRIWYIFGSAHIGCDFDILSLEAALGWKPYGSDYTVADLLKMTSLAISSAKGWENTPLVGESFTFGNSSACDYCPVKGVCWTQAKGAPI